MTSIKEKNYLTLSLSLEKLSKIVNFNLYSEYHYEYKIKNALDGIFNLSIPSTSKEIIYSELIKCNSKKSILKLISDDSPNIIINCSVKGREDVKVKVLKNDFLSFLNSLDKNFQKEKDKDFIKLINDITSTEAFIYRYKDELIEGISIFDICKFVSLSLEEIFIYSELDTFNNIKMPLFLKAISSFFNNNNILERFRLSERVKEKLKFINKLSTKLNYYTPPKYCEEIEINEGLFNSIISFVPDNASKLEKAVLIYTFLCLKLSYDENYWLSDDINKRDIKRLKEIDLVNNKVICYEFNAIYAYFLKYLDIPFTISREEYGPNHNVIEMNINNTNYVVDAVKGVIGGDLTKAKSTGKITGIESIGKGPLLNDAIKFAFSILLSDPSNKKIDISKIRGAKVEKKIAYYLNRLENTNLSEIDRIFLMIYLKRSLKLDDYLKINVYANSMPLDKEKEVSLCVLIEDTLSKTYYRFENEYKVSNLKKEEYYDLVNKRTLRNIDGIRGI